MRLFTSDAQAPTFIGLGVVMDASGTIATDTGALGQRADATIILPDGSHVRAFVRARDSASGIALLNTATSTKEGSTPAWTPAAFATGHATLGQTVVALSGNTVTRVSNGIVSAIEPATKSTPELIDTSVPEASITAGSPLIDTGGALMGISTEVSRGSTGSAFIPASALVESATAK